MKMTEFPVGTASEDGVFARSEIAARDGFRLVVYRSDAPVGAPVVVAVNALGFPARFFEPLAEIAKGRARLVTWDQRAMPGPGLTDGTDVTPRTHARDLADIIQALGLSNVRLLGFCNGAEVAILAAADAPAVPIARLVLSNGHFGLTGAPDTPNTHGLLALLASLRKSPERAEPYYRILSAEPSVKAPVDSVILKYPFRHGPDKLIRLANMLENIGQDDIAETAGRLGLPVSVFVARSDDISHPRHSELIAELMPEADIRPVADAGHYSLHTDADYGAAVLACLLDDAPAKIADRTWPQPDAVESRQ